MTVLADDAPPGRPIAAMPAPAGPRHRRWPALAGAVLTAAMLVGLGRELLGAGVSGLHALVPTNPLFYAALALFYLTPPACDYLIYRRLWGIPLAGFAALARKRIANDVLFGYAGDAYFYAWARAHGAAHAPFGAVKDSTILSAMAGNAVTLALMACALPLGWRLLDGGEMRILLASAAVIVAMSVPFLALRKRVFSLPAARLWEIFGVHCGRQLVASALLAIAWHFALPMASLGVWVLLVAGRLFVSRLPLMPNKDLLFANFAIILIGNNQAVTGLVALTAALILVAHVTLLAVFGVVSLARKFL